MSELSKFMSYALRHEPKEVGISLDKNGWVSISDLAKSARKQYDWVTEEDIIQEVEKGKKEGNKERFEIKDNKVRAKYGHNEKLNITIDENSEENIPSELYHGTPKENVESIMDEGIQPMSRQDVHLTDNVEDAKNVAKRRSNSISVLVVNCDKMVDDGYSISDRGDVYTVSEVPPKYIK